MDDIQRVDCFERLYNYLIQHQPDLQNRLDSLEPNAYCRADLRFFLIHLVALLSGLDVQTAEGKRQVRKLVIELDEESPSKVAHEKLHERMRIREESVINSRPFNETQKKNLRLSFQNLRELTEGQNPPGLGFERLLENLNFLPERIHWLRKLLPSLSSLNAFRYLNQIGYPVIVPDSRCQNFLFRLGLIENKGGSLKQQIEACRVAEDIGRTLKRPVDQINLMIQAFVGGLQSVNPIVSLCRAQPDCGRCSLTSYCHYFRFQRPPAADSSSTLSIKNWRATDRPRERLIEQGSNALEEIELLAIVLRTGTGKTNVLELSRQLLDKFRTLEGIEEASLEELQTLKGIGQMKAVELKAVFELGRRLTYKPMRSGESFISSEQVFNSYRGRYETVKQEEFILLMLDNKNRVIREEVISRGGLDSAIVHPREVFKVAIRASAASVLFIHNHPSGDPSPSQDDYSITSQLEEAAELLKIKVLDHVIIGSESYFSFTEGEVITPEEN